MPGESKIPRYMVFPMASASCLNNRVLAVIQ
jgi:hypothetical protein